MFHWSWKQWLVLVIVAFFIYYMFNSPEEASATVRGIGSSIMTGFRRVDRFLDGLQG